jgi:hypothetical protein
MESDSRSNSSVGPTCVASHANEPNKDLSAIEICRKLSGITVPSEFAISDENRPPN